MSDLEGLTIYGKADRLAERTNLSNNAGLELRTNYYGTQRRDTIPG